MTADNPQHPGVPHDATVIALARLGQHTRDTMFSIIALKSLPTQGRAHTGLVCTMVRSDDNIHYSSSYELEPATKIELTEMSHDTLVAHFMASEHYASCVELLNGTPDSDTLLKDFVSHEMLHHLDISSGIGAKLITSEQHATAFLSRVRKTNRNFRLTVGVIGVSIGAVIALDLHAASGTARAVLRPVVREDLTIFRPDYMFSVTEKRETPTAILTIHVEAESLISPVVLFEFAHQIHNNFLMWRAIGIGYTSSEFSTDDLSDKSFANHYLQHPERSPRRFTYLDAAAAAEFETFSNALSRRLTELHAQGGQEALGHANSPVHMGMKHLDRAVFDNSMEESVTESMIGLEALFVRERAEVSYRLKLRASKFLATMGADPVASFKLFGHGYEIRSSYSHGTPIDIKDRTKAEAINLREELEKSLGLAVAGFIRRGIGPVGSRDKLLEEIDLSLLTSPTQ